MGIVPNAVPWFKQTPPPSSAAELFFLSCVPWGPWPDGTWGERKGGFCSVALLFLFPRPRLPSGYVHDAATPRTCTTHHRTMPDSTVGNERGPHTESHPLPAARRAAQRPGALWYGAGVWVLEGTCPMNATTYTTDERRAAQNCERAGIHPSWALPAQTTSASLLAYKPHHVTHNTTHRGLYYARVLRAYSTSERGRLLCGSLSPEPTRGRERRGALRTTHCSLLRG